MPNRGSAITILDSTGTRSKTGQRWDDRCDVYIDAPTASINTINLKGRPETQLYVCGQIYYVKNFKLKYGCVGDTYYYDEDFGLGYTSLIPPNKILLKWGWTTAPLLGVSY